MSTRVSIDIQPQVISASPKPGQPQERLEVEDGSTPRDDMVYPTGLKLWLPVTSVLMVALAKGLDTTVVAVTVPSLTDHFKTVKDIGWYSAAAGLSLSAFTLFFGKTYTVFRLKPVFITSVAIFTLGSLLCTIAPTSSIFILGRAFSGLGSGGIGNGATVILSRLLPLAKRPLWFGICAGIQSIGLISAPLIGGALIDSYSWRACFGINLPVGVAAILLIWLSFQDPIPQPESDKTLAFSAKLIKLDLIGTIFIVPCITCLLLALQWGGTRDRWNSLVIVFLFALFGLLLIGFGLSQYRYGSDATVPPNIVKNRSMLAGMWFQACCDGTLAITEYYFAIYFQGVRGFSATKSGALGLPMIIGLMIATMAAGAGTTAFGYYTPFMLATTIIAPIPAGILTTFHTNDSLVKILVCLGLLGVAIGLGIGGPFSACQTVLEPSEIPIGNAMLTFCGGLGVSMFVSASSALFQNRLVKELSIHAPGVNATTVENAGLSEIRRVIGKERLGDVLLGFDQAVVQTLYLPVALTVASVVGSAAMEWKSVKRKVD